MWSKEELQGLHLNMLAMLCLRIVESGTANSEEREEAGGLRREWALLIGNSKPVLPGLHTQQDMEAYEEGLKERIVAFLAGLSHHESILAGPIFTSNGNARGAAAGRPK